MMGGKIMIRTHVDSTRRRRRDGEETEKRRRGDEEETERRRRGDGEKPTNMTKE